jgi:membrane-bound lytic murein transglycosylase B
MKIESRLRPMAGVAALVAAMGVAADTASAADAFDRWLVGLRHEAHRNGVKYATLNAALRGVRPIPRVIELSRRQPEFTLTLDRYLGIVLTQERIDHGRERFRRYRTLLRRASRAHGVQPQYIVALWGIETKYGTIMGGFPVIGALATLAYQGGRRRFFRSELLKALKILDQGHITPDRMVGSWAGAMGQNQFMPSSFLAYAVDGNGDGKRDIWGSLPDVFASTANYLRRVGWRRGEAWGREVRLSKRFNRALVNGRRYRTVKTWARLGVRRADGGPLPRANVRGRVIMPIRNGGRAFLVYKNFRAIKRWNNSDYFAIAVGMLADRIVAAPAGR